MPQEWSASLANVLQQEFSRLLKGKGVKSPGSDFSGFAGTSTTVLSLNHIVQWIIDSRNISHMCHDNKLFYEKEAVKKQSPVLLLDGSHQ